MANGIFSARYKFPIHMLQVVLVFTVLILSVVRMFNRPKNAPRSRAGTMSLGMAAKSLIILAYEILSSHVRAFKKYASLKAYLILNGLEVVFWGAVVFLMIQANIKFCSGISCTLAWVIVPMAIIMNLLASYMTMVSWVEYRDFKEGGGHDASKHSKSYSTDSIELEASPRMSQRAASHAMNNYTNVPRTPQTQPQQWVRTKEGIRVENRPSGSRVNSGSGSHSGSRTHSESRSHRHNNPARYQGSRHSGSHASHHSHSRPHSHSRQHSHGGHHSHGRRHSHSRQQNNSRQQNYSPQPSYQAQPSYPVQTAPPVYDYTSNGYGYGAGYQTSPYNQGYNNYGHPSQ